MPTTIPPADHFALNIERDLRKHVTEHVEKRRGPIGEKNQDELCGIVLVRF